MHSDILKEIKAVLSAYPELPKGKNLEYERIPHGHINHSYKLETDSKCLFIQCLNVNIFPNVAAMCNQIEQVTQHLACYYQKNNLPYEAVNFYKTFSNQIFYQIGRNFYRICDYKSALVAHQLPTNNEMVLSAGEAFAHFAKGLIDLPVADAFFPIRRFHDLAFRYQQLQEAKQNSNQATALLGLFQICDKLFDLLKPVLRYLEEGNLPSRWVHNDTKLNNLLFDKQLDARCVVDLDTVMPGSLIFDIGDALRTMGSSLEEDDSELDKLHINKPAIDSFLQGYVSVIGEHMTSEEKEMIPYSGIYMSAIMGYRFLTDFLSGNRYYRVKYPNHNLDRARNQLTLAVILSEDIGKVK